MNSTRFNRHDDDEMAYTAQWGLTFADLCTLLLSFFVLFLSMSTLDRDKFLETFNKGSVQEGSPDSRHPRWSERILADIDRITLGLPGRDFRRAEIDDARLANPKFQFDAAPGVTIRFHQAPRMEKFLFAVGESMIFTSGQTEISDEGLQILKAIGSHLHESGSRVLVKAKFSEKRLDGSEERFNANQNILSLLIGFLIDRCGVKAEQISIGIADPESMDNPSDNKEADRRIDLVFERPIQ